MRSVKIYTFKYTYVFSHFVKNANTSNRYIISNSFIFICPFGSLSYYDMSVASSNASSSQTAMLCFLF
jgi:hypothetical protein